MKYDKGLGRNTDKGVLVKYGQMILGEISINDLGKTRMKDLGEIRINGVCGIRINIWVKYV